MRVTVTMTGGFAGLRLVRAFDTADLGDAERARVEGLLAVAAASQTPRPKRARDARAYRFEVGDGPAAVGAVVTEGASAEGDELLEAIRAHLPVLR